MDTTEAASRIGTTPRVLRAFLRTPYSTFVAVGSGARYDFSESDIPILSKRYGEWRGAGRPKPTPAARKAQPVVRAEKQLVQRKRDVEVWEEEGDVTLPDIRDPRVRARVLREAKAAEEQLMMLLYANGMHVLQKGDRKIA